METMELFVYREKAVHVTWYAGHGVGGKCVMRLTPQGDKLEIEVEHLGNVEVDSHVPSL